MIESDLAAIQRLLSDFAWHADRGDGASLAALFLPDGILWVGGQEHKGRVQIADDCHRRSLNPQRKTRHVWSNLRIDPQDDDTYVSTAIQQTFEQTGPDNAAQLRISDLFDKFKRDPQGAWRFMTRTIDRQMSLVL